MNITGVPWGVVPMPLGGGVGVPGGWCRCPWGVVSVSLRGGVGVPQGGVGVPGGWCRRPWVVPVSLRVMAGLSLRGCCSRPSRRDHGPGTKDQGPGTKDHGPGTRDQEPKGSNNALESVSGGSGGVSRPSQLGKSAPISEQLGAQIQPW